MPRYVALLRAINVGGHTVRMERLRALFEELGFANVRTVIASGNVLFETRARDAAKLERGIERHLAAALGYEVTTFLRTPAELAAALDAQPFGTDADVAGAVLYLGFLHDRPPAEAVRRLLSWDGPRERVRVVGREVYWLLFGRMSEARFSGALLEKELGRQATFRNANTVRRLAAPAPAQDRPR